MRHAATFQLLMEERQKLEVAKGKAIQIDLRLPRLKRCQPRR